MPSPSRIPQDFHWNTRVCPPPCLSISDGGGGGGGGQRWWRLTAPQIARAAPPTRHHLSSTANPTATHAAAAPSFSYGSCAQKRRVAPPRSTKRRLLVPTLERIQVDKLLKQHIDTVPDVPNCKSLIVEITCCNCGDGTLCPSIT